MPYTAAERRKMAEDRMEKEQEAGRNARQNTREKEAADSMIAQWKKTACRFAMEGIPGDPVPFGNGHINDTLCVSCKTEDGKEKRYILQRINQEVFKKPEQVMENIVKVTAFLRKKIRQAGGDPERETLNVVPTLEGENCLRDENGSWWRMYHFIEDTICLEEVRTPEDFYNSAVAFGNFQRLLADFPAEQLHESIPDFHNTVQRFENFRRALEKDVCGRAAGVEREIRFFLDREADTHEICDALKEGRIPLRVTHNDTKLNNIMIDTDTGKGICVVDLDTVMPGSALYDFGDSIRFGASTAAEDEKDLSLVSCSLSLYETYARGYVRGCGGSLTDEEIRLLPVGARLMTLECGMRFLTDYLEGDVYFKIHRPEHNLDRARTQIRLVEDMEAKWDLLSAIGETLGKTEKTEL